MEKVTEPKTMDDPYPDKTPRSVLTREYLIFSANVAMGTDLILWPQDLLLAQNVLKTYLKPFRYLRNNIKLKFQFVTNPLQYGLVGISRLPYMLPTDNYSTSVYQQSQSEQEILDIASQEAYTLELPFLNPYNYLDIRTTTQGLRQWRIMIHPYYIGTMTMGAPTTIRLDIFASMPDPEVAGYQATNFTFLDSEFQSSSYEHPLRALGAIGEFMGYNYLAPGLSKYGHEPVNLTDHVAMHHDICYARSKTTGDLLLCDNEFVTGLRDAWKRMPYHERPAALASMAAIKGQAIYRILMQSGDIELNPGPPKPWHGPGFSANTTSTTAPTEVNDSRTQDTKNEMQRLRMDLVGDISSPAVKDLSTVSRLGDNIEPVFTSMPKERNIYGIKDVCMQPVFVQDGTLVDTTGLVSINVTPIWAFSHASYMAQMFKFYRGGTRLLFKFATSQLFSARIQVTLWPAAVNTGPAIPPIGDLPTWILTIKGTRDFYIKVPWLQTKPWSNLWTDTTVTPVVTVQLLDNIPQSFDKTTPLYFAIFASPDSDFELAGLQSVVPAGIGGFDSDFQCITDDFSRSPDVEYLFTTPRPYMGGLSSIQQILNRYSSRGITGTAVPDGDKVSYPLQITSWAQLYANFDNFDYVCNLYKFFSGECQTKTIFSGAPASGVIAAYILNGLASIVTGDDLKAGNSMAITHQAVWPELDVTFPYMAEIPYNGVRSGDQSGMYSIAYNNGTVVSKFLISAAPNFQLFYLMPVPDFYAVARPTVSVEPKSQEYKDSEFQMASPLVPVLFNYKGINCFTFPGTTGSGISAAVPIGFYSAEGGPDAASLYNLDYELVLIRKSGTTSGSFLVCWTADPTNIDLSGEPLSLDLDTYGHAFCIASWQDDANSGVKTVSLKGSFTNLGTNFNSLDGPLQYIKICPLDIPPLTGSQWTFLIVTNISPVSSNVGILSPSQGGVALMPCTTGNESLTTILNSPVSVSLDAVTLSSPLEVTVENESVDVNVVEPSPFHVIVSNDISTPVYVDVVNPITVAGSVSITGEVAVLGTADQTLPVWVTQYGPP